MRFHRIEEAVLLGFAGIGLSVLALSGAPGVVVGVLSPVAFLLALAVPRSWMESRRWERAWTIVAVVVVAAEAAAALAGAPLLRVTAQLAVYFQVHRLFRRVNARDHEQIVFLALGHVAFATILLTGLKYALLLLVFVIFTPLLLTLLHLRREIEQKYSGTPEGGRDDQTLGRVLRTRRVATPGFVAVLLASAVPLLALTALFFLALPRLGFGLLAGRVGGSYLVGFSDRLQLGDLVPLADDRTPVMRVEFPDGVPSTAALAELHFRGTTFDTYDGRAWTRTAYPDADWSGLHRPPTYDTRTPGRPPTSQFRVRALQEPFDTRLLFLPAGTQEFKFRGPKPRRPGPPESPLEWQADGAVGYREAGEEGVSWEAKVGRWPDGVRTHAAGVRPGRPDAPDPYLVLPPGAERIRDLARRLTAGLDDPRARADAILRFLRGNLRYTRSRHAEAGERPLEDFLFRWKEGHCEYFSSAMVLLARAAGLRARNVSGFLGGHWNAIGDYLVVRQSDAHAWAEVEIPGEGWLIYDATPPSEVGSITATGGFWGWLGDVLDALRTAWHRHVIAFDLPHQIGVLRALADGYRRARAAVVSFAGRHRWLVAALAVGIGVVPAAVWLLRRRRPGRDLAQPGPGAARARAAPRDLAEARRLLLSLERSLHGLGVERAAHEPVDRLVERAARLGPILASATGAAVRRYSAARFGGRHLSAGDRRALVHDVDRAVRQS